MSNQNDKKTVSFFASVELAITLMSLTALTVLVGAWCPQESQVGRQKVFETFGPDMANNLIKWGVSDIFHSPWFLFLIAMLTVNMVAVSFQRVFPRVRLLKQVMPFLKGREIEKMPVARKVVFDNSAPTDQTVSPSMLQSFVVNELAKRRFNVRVDASSITAEYGKFGRLAATITHIGLLTLLAGVTVTSWTGFSGFQPVRQGDTMSLAKSEHSKLWIGKLPSWSVKVDSTRRESYPTGEPKQWYSELSVVDAKGKVLTKGEISVNNPLSYDGVDIYQSSWGMDVIDLSFNGHDQRLPLEAMGKRYAAFLPLDKSTVLIFSVLDTTSPLRVFAKRTDWEAPKMVGEIKPQESIKMGSVEVTFKNAIAATGLQYKCDPGIPIVYTAFGFIILGVLLASIPHRHIWVWVEPKSSDEDALVLYIGGKSIKARVGFEKLIDRLVESVAQLAPSTVVSASPETVSHLPAEATEQAPVGAPASRRLLEATSQNSPEETHALAGAKSGDS